MIDGLQTVTLEKDQFVIKEGEEGQEFYIIEQGEVDCVKLCTYGDRSGFAHVRVLKKGEHFGELALINNEKRSLSIRVKTDKCRLLRLDRETFSRVLGAIEQFLKKDYDHEFDKKIEGMLLKGKEQKRTLSQTFPADEF